MQKTFRNRPHTAPLAVAALLLSGAAMAQDSVQTQATPAPKTSVTASVGTGGATAERKLVLGLRPAIGWGVAMGDIANGSKLSDIVVGQVPIWLDIGYMITPNILLGIYWLYGIALPVGGGNGSDIRFGVQGQYHLSPAGKIDPWFGLGIGYEYENLNIVLINPFSGEVDVSESLTGWEFANLQAALDFKLWPIFGLGPYVSFSLGQYSSESTTFSYNGNQSGSIAEKAMHEWLTFGVHTTLSLRL